MIKPEEIFLKGRPVKFLIGFMGSGKSHWGQIWAEKYKLPFIDLDHEIEVEMGLSIEKIFEQHGENEFRRLETAHLRKIKSNEGVIIACGGGTPCFSDNMDWMLDHGAVIYLKASSGYLQKRVLNEKSKRPLLKKLNESDLLYFIQNKLAEREPVYQRAHVIMDIETLSENSPDEAQPGTPPAKEGKASM